MNKELKNKFINCVSTLNSPNYQKLLEIYRRDMYSNYTLDELNTFRTYMFRELFQEKSKLESKKKDCEFILRESYETTVFARYKKIKQDLDFITFKLGVLNNIVDNYTKYNYIKIPTTLTVREYDIRTPKGNKARKPKVLEGGKVLLCIEEFLSTSPARHGMYYKLLDETDNYIYFVSTKDVKPITEKTYVKEWYLRIYPTDDLGNDLKGNITFKDVYYNLGLGGGLYEFVGIEDSIVRERIFEQLAIIKGVGYDVIYDKWMGW